MADAIVLELEGDKIVVTFRRKGGEPLTRRIELTAALELSCLMLRAGSLKCATNIVIPGMTLQVAPGRSAHAWLGMSRDGEPDLIACIAGPTVREIGRRLHDHWLTAKGQTFDGPERSIYVRPVAQYLDDDEDEHSGA